MGRAPGRVEPESVGDAIEVLGLRVLGTHGVLDEERHRPQPFEVDLCVWADLSAAAASDLIGDTVDYGALTALAVGVVSGRSFHLLEALAEHIASTLVDSDDRIEGVRVTVRKLRPPLPVDVGAVAVRRTRWRAGPSGRPPD